MNQLERQGEGSRGAIFVNFAKFVGVKYGHAMSWEVRNGQVIVSDPQSGKTGKAVMDVFSVSDPNQYTYVRLDNLQPSEEVTRNVISKKDR